MRLVSLFFRLAFFLLCCFSCPTAIQAQQTGVSQLVKAYNDSIWHYRNTASDKALTFSKMALVLHPRDTSWRNKTITCLRTGVVYDLIFMPDSALWYYNLAQQYARKGKVRDLESAVSNNIGLVYWNQDKLKEALEAYMKALRIAEELQDTAKIGHACNNIGLVFIGMGNTEKSMLYHERAIACFTKINDSYALASAMNNLAMAVPDTTPQAYILRKKVIDIQESIQDAYGLGKSYSNMAYIFIKRKEYQKAKAYFELSLKNHRKAGNKAGLASTYYNLGIFYQHNLQNDEEALIFLRKSMPYVYATRNNRIRYKIQEHLAEIYYRQGKYRDAYQMLDSASVLKHTLYNEEMSQHLETLETRYDLTQKQNEIHLLRQKEQDAQLNIALSEISRNRKDTIIYSLVTLLLLLIVAVFSGMKWYRFRQQTAYEQERNRVVFESEQKERIRIARDLHDSIGQKLSVMKMLLSSFPVQEEKKLKTGMEKIVRYLDETVDEVRTISHNLFPESLNLGLIKAVEAAADKINETGGGIRLEVAATDTGSTPGISKDAEVSVFRIIQEVLNNMIRHSGATVIRIIFDKKDGLMQLVISDNGIGMDISSIERSKGIGWQNVFARARLVNVRLQVHSEKGKGTAVRLTAPLLGNL